MKTPKELQKIVNNATIEDARRWKETEDRYAYCLSVLGDEDAQEFVAPLEELYLEILLYHDELCRCARCGVVLDGFNVYFTAPGCGVCETCKLALDDLAASRTPPVNHLKFYLDGRQNRGTQTVKAVVMGAGLDGEDELHVALTGEGLIIDLVADGEVVATAGYDWSELEELTH